ncbi:type II toxin-antitoxin system HipA family toxin YjjJ [Glaciimonas sp. PCH181]|uniref:type II toxin-antitoxin system HipA family toxin YjjJ n=1 Tax=Glaciimonas sp. PCH181 TaxID=2133943 RepID=UPI000D343F9E|nr:type II toxin-antitoxin system HipA family toxin YjjJ [Glaciimonas sp. PCH181]PUA18989.1 transcriptional regulator [Glaciimonas sp. PCH181]
MAFNRSKDNIAELRRLLASAPSNAKTLSAALGISQPTFSRLWPTAGNDIVALGAARATLYGLTRRIRDIGPTHPILRINAQGESEDFALLTVLAGHWYAYQFTDSSDIFTCEGLPYFLQDLRPQGFLGRLAPRENADLTLPSDIVEWTDDDALYYLARRGDDNMGDLIVGNESYRRFFAQKSNADKAFSKAFIQASERDVRYPELAERALKGETVGSSAGGEQPKFTTAILRGAADPIPDHVIVKFSPDIRTASGRRWGDLLVAEHLALETLRRNTIPAAESNILVAANRVFLESVRFDRIGTTGRTSMVSLAGLVGETGAADKTWSYAAAILANRKKLSVADLAMIQLLDVYGTLIGNSDRHPGNLSLSWTSDGTFALRPCYDMLPMMYRPNSQGEVVEREFNLSGLDRLDLRFLQRASDLANQFWDSVQTDARISEDFKRVARLHVAVMHPA